MWRGVALGVLALLAACNARFDVPSGGMAPTIIKGDRISAESIDADEVSRGDIILYESTTPGPLEGEIIVQRVLGLPGERVRMADNVVLIDGVPLASELVSTGHCVVVPSQDRFRGIEGPCVTRRESVGGRSWLTQHIAAASEHAERALPSWPLRSGFGGPSLRVGRLMAGAEQGNDELPDMRVPAGHYFMLGDNRDGSNDSRYEGFVPASALRYRAVAVTHNDDDPARSDLPLR